MRLKYIPIILAFVVCSFAEAQITTDALLDTIQHTAFNFFWQQANAANGLIKDRSTSGSPCSIASTGFGLTAICIAVDHGWVTRQAARDRVLTTLKTFWNGPQGAGTSGYIGAFGLFYHFLDMTTATRTWNCELSTIDTGLLLAGIVDAKQYFTGTDSTETNIRALADSIYYRMDWNYMRNRQWGILMGWTPESGFTSFGQWTGYCEASIMYILALGSPTHPVGYEAWLQWVSGYSWQTYYGFTYVIFPPLFGHQYSQCWLDLRNINDEYMRYRGITYFENSRKATLAQRAYSIAGPGQYYGYNDSLWGITASDYPGGYIARGAPPAQNDDGTIAPTAPISSIPFAPEECIRFARNMFVNYNAQLWTQYGFRDAFNLGHGWYDSDIIGIDQGPMIIMIENYRNQRVWNRFMQNADIQRGLQAAQFLPLTGVDDKKPVPTTIALQQNYPNPFNPTTEIRYSLPQRSNVALKVYNMLGIEVAELTNGTQEAGEYTRLFDANNLPSGVYLYTLRAGGVSQTRKMIVLR